VAETCGEPRAWVFLFLDAVLADSQLAFDREKPRRYGCPRLQQGQEERDGISGKLPDGLNNSGSMPQQILKDVHGRRIGILPQNGEKRNSLRNNQ
jgi:hypothetical protein